jgi:hypothetical protein
MPVVLRTQGSITTARSLWQQRRDGFPSDNRYHAVWVPAIAGTTDEIAFRDVCMCLSAGERERPRPLYIRARFSLRKARGSLAATSGPR